ncbi:hypothetical protein FOZ63_012674, partial [Perkinsus olseni]
SRILEVYAWEEEAVLLKHTRRAKRATSYKLHPHPLSWNKKERGPLDRVYASANCTFLVTEEGKVFGSGLNNFAQLGLGKTTAEPIRNNKRVRWGNQNCLVRRELLSVVLMQPRVTGQCDFSGQ